MGEEVRDEAAAGDNAAEKAGDARKTRSIRFSDCEWEEVKRAARGHDMPAAEFVRQTILRLVRAPGDAGPHPVPPSWAPLIERMFRYSWFLATEKRDGTRWSARGARRNSTSSSPRPARSRNRSAGTPRIERNPLSGRAWSGPRGERCPELASDSGLADESFGRAV